jgi:uncharacterized protein
VKHVIGALLLAALLLGAGFADGQTSNAPEQQFLYMLQPTRADMLKTGSTNEERAVIEEHFNHLKALTKQGVVILAGRTTNTDETAFGVVIFRAASADAARDIMNSDPVVKQGVMKATLFSFHVALLEGKLVD